MSKVIDSIIWPALRFTEPTGTVMVCRERNDLLTARYIGIPDLAKLSEVYLIDSEGIRFDFRGLRLDGPPPSLVKRMLLKVTNPLVRITGEVTGRPDPVSLDAVKETVGKSVMRHKDYWWEIDDPAAIVTEIERADSVLAIARVLEGNVSAMSGEQPL